ncbi:hypothetical protein [Neobacillus vireti]|uniref:hypothetical protein n=1 Tax=Neobacillus vireti TaxID=220686 RepID=UPI002FFE8CD4
MNEMIELFLSAIKERGHVLKLIEHLDGLKIKLVCEDHEIFLIFHRGEVSVFVDNGEKLITPTISGQKESIFYLLQGKETLRNLIRNGQLVVNAPFRIVLLIESIFYLTKPKVQLSIS